MKSTTRLYTSTIVAALGGLLFGFDTAVISGTTAALQEYFGLSEAMLGFTVVTALIGTVLGSIAVSRPADIWGRKRVLIVLAVLYTVSAIGSGLAWNLYAFWFFRLLGGLAVGGASVVSPMYIAEISPAEKRGRLVGWQQFNVCFGICLAYISNYFVAASGLFAESIHSPMAEWRWMFMMEAIPSIAFFIFLFRIPFSPRWLVEQKRMEDAFDVLKSVGAADPKAVLDEIIESMHEKFDAVHAKFWTRALWLPITAAIALAVFNQLSGINALLYYAPKVFTMGGSEGDVALLQSIPIGIMLVIGTAIGLALIDKLGRKLLLIVGSLGMAVFLALVGLKFRGMEDGGQVSNDVMWLVHRLPVLLRPVHRRRDLGLHLGDLSEPGPRQGPGAGQFHPLVHGRRGFAELPDRRGGQKYRPRQQLSVLRRLHGRPGRLRLARPTGDKRRLARSTAEETRDRVEMKTQNQPARIVSPTIGESAIESSRQNRMETMKTSRMAAILTVAMTSER